MSPRCRDYTQQKHGKKHKPENQRQKPPIIIINTVKNASEDIKMEYGLDKCAKASFKRGKQVSAEGIPLNDNQVIQDLDQAETYSTWEWRREKGSNTTK